MIPRKKVSNNDMRPAGRGGGGGVIGYMTRCRSLYIAVVVVDVVAVAVVVLLLLLLLLLQIFFNEAGPGIQ